MKDEKNIIKIICYIGAVTLFVMSFLSLVSTVYGDVSGQDDFILPEWGGGMVHSDPQMSDNIRLQVPTTNVGILWYRHDLGGELFGGAGIGIAGNSKIAASTFQNIFGYNNLIIYDYYGNHIWNDNQYLNFLACSSTPMVDMHDWVVACDNKTIILINASNPDDVHKWNSSIPLDPTTWRSIKTPYSPNIVENRTIILPTSNGPLLAYDVHTGEKLAEIYLGENETIDPYWGAPEMNCSDFITVMTSPLPWPIACPYHFNSSNNGIEWNSTVPYGIMPFNPPFFKDNIMFCANRIDPRNVTAYNISNPFNITILGSNLIEYGEYYTGEGFFSTLNSACVKDNRVFIATQYKKPGTRPSNHTISRLYAVDVNPDAINENERLNVTWNYTYFGTSQASPTLINDTIYFDGYNESSNPDDRDPHIYAVYTNGTERWNVSYDNITCFSFSMDPRGGFWYEDSGLREHGGGGKKLVRFYEENGSIQEEINESKLAEFVNDSNYLTKNKPLYPCSCMTICGTSTDPIMIVSINHDLGVRGKWVIAINLSDNNSLLWKVQTDLIDTPFHINWPGGQYTILKENNESRILFGTTFGGVMAIGRFSDCWFQDIDYQLKDSNGDIYNDTIQLNYTIKTSLPDRVLVKATLISIEHPILCRYKTEKHYNVTSASIEGNLTITLPPQAPKGVYILQVLLYNSSGETIRKSITLFDYMDFGIFANDTYLPFNMFYMYPPNNPPNPPERPCGNNSVVNKGKFSYTTNATDPNGDNIWYQWRWNISPNIYLYTPWITGGPYNSGENCTKDIGWPFPGDYQVQVRAKDYFLNPNVMSDWSPPLNVTVNQSDGSSSWDNELFDVFSSSVLLSGEQTGCSGFAEGVNIDTNIRSSLNWTWYFGDGNISYGENVVHIYSSVGNYTVYLNITNGEYWYNCTTNISVLILKAGFNTSGVLQPDETVFFNDISDGYYNIINWSWDFGDGNISYQQNANHTYPVPGEYNVSLIVTDEEDNTHTCYKNIFVETVLPSFVSVIDVPDVVGFGSDVNIFADFFDNQSMVKDVFINVFYPDNTSKNFTMDVNMSVPYDYMLVFNDTWQNGLYNYSVYVLDNAGNTNCTSGFNFTVSAQANMSICTVKDSYGSNEIINLTDPPGSNPLSQGSIGYELLDNGSVLHVWNNFDHYYFNTSNGIQLTNHYNKYWSHNVLMLGYYNNDQWHLIYRTDELSGFNKNIDTDNETYVNATLWKDLTYQGYDFRLALRYHLGVDDKELTIIPYIKNLGISIPYNLGFAWEIKDIQVNMTPSGDYIEVNGSTYYLNQSLDETYKNMGQSCFSIREDISSDRSESLYLCWNDSLDYLVKVKSREGQYNAPVTLGIKMGTLGVGQEKYTSLLWHDTSEITYYFNSYNTGEKWTTNPGYMVDGSTSTYASTTTNGKVELCNGNTCPGLILGEVIKVELRTYGYYTGTQRNIILRPVFDGTTDGRNYDYVTTTTPSWSEWFEITSDPTAPPWDWTKVKNLDCDVEARSSVGSFTLYCSKVEIRVTYNIDPVISNPYPVNGSTGISIAPVLNITVSDPDGSCMNITWYSNSSGSWQVFGTNNSVGNGTYHKIMSNASINGMWWYWKVCVNDGFTNVYSSVFKFYTGNESRIIDTGSTNFSGYLLMQVQYYDSGEWVLDDDTVNETTPRAITSGQQLALDTIFNSLVNTNDLTHSDGLYRVYAAFRDPEGNVLVCDDDSLLEATYEFTVNI